MPIQMLVYLLLSTLTCSVEAALQLQSSVSTTLKTSVIVPCCAQHAQHLSTLLELLEKQTELPEEVVISLSGITSIEKIFINNITSRDWLFPVKLILTDQNMYAGQNRNRACKHADGEILITQDADDIPHPQRIEIIKYLFKKYRIDHLMHMWTMAKPKSSVVFTKYNDFRNLPFFYPKTYDDIRGNRMTNGNIALSKRVFKEMQWSDMPRGQDTDFNKNVYMRFRKRLALRLPLLAYRKHLSSQASHQEPAVDNTIIYDQNLLASHQIAKRYSAKIIWSNLT